MPVPRILKYEPVSDKKTVKSNIIIRQLFGMGYDVDDARSTVKLIEDNNLDKSQFDFPYGSFEEFQKHVDAGEFDYKFSKKNMYVTDEQRKQIEQEMREGKGWTY